MLGHAATCAMSIHVPVASFLAVSGVLSARVVQGPRRFKTAVIYPLSLNSPNSCLALKCAYTAIILQLRFFIEM